MSESEIASLARSKGDALAKPHRELAERTAQIVPTLVANASSLAGLAMARQWLLTIKATIERIEAERKSVVGPFQDAIKNLNAYFAAPVRIYEEAESALKKAIAEYSRVEQAKREAQASAGLPVLAAPPLADTKGISIVERTKWEIVDPDFVPRQFCSPDDRKIRAYLANGGLESMPGVRFYKEDQVRASRKGL